LQSPISLPPEAWSLSVSSEKGSNFKVHLRCLTFPFACDLSLNRRTLISLRSPPRSFPWIGISAVLEDVREGIRVREVTGTEGSLGGAQERLWRITPVSIQSVTSNDLMFLPSRILHLREAREREEVGKDYHN